MAIGGIVVTLSEGDLATHALAWIAAEPRIEQGPRVGARMAVVLATESLVEGEALCRELLDLPGVVNVEVAYLANEDEASSCPSEAPMRATAS